jgi:GAF domain-containing protein
MRFPAEHGIAGWVLATRTPLILEDVRNDPRFAGDVAQGTGYVPSGLMAAPLLYDERALGVLEVLDRPERAHFSLQEMDLLGLFANQAAIAVDLLLRARQTAARRRTETARRSRRRRSARGRRNALEEEQRTAVSGCRQPGRHARPWLTKLARSWGGHDQPRRARDVVSWPSSGRVSFRSTSAEAEQILG